MRAGSPEAAALLQESEPISPLFWSGSATPTAILHAPASHKHTHIHARIRVTPSKTFKSQAWDHKEIKRLASEERVVVNLTACRMLHEKYQKSRNGGKTPETSRFRRTWGSKPLGTSGTAAARITAELLQQTAVISSWNRIQADYLLRPAGWPSPSLVPNLGSDPERGGRRSTERAAGSSCRHGARIGGAVTYFRSGMLEIVFMRCLRSHACAGTSLRIPRTDPSGPSRHPRISLSAAHFQCVILLIYWNGLF